LSLGECKSVYGKGNDLLNQKFLARRAIQCGPLHNALFDEHWSNNRHTYFKDTDFAFICTQIYINPKPLQNGSHHNLGTRGFDKNVLQIFLHNIYRKPPAITHLKW
jgi:hypothetical protein